MAARRQRLDLLLVERGLYKTRSRAGDAIRRGGVMVEGRHIEKPGASVPVNAAIEVADEAARYVSRAALKLIHALDHFALPPQGLNVLDLGASTGGFCQVLLERGAARIFAVDVGHGQLAPGIAADKRVMVFEDLNARDLSCKHIPESIGMITCDVSFIPLKLALPAALGLAAAGATLIALIKPQFEAGRDNIEKDGVVRNVGVLQRVCAEFRDWLETAQNWQVLGITPSPVTGADGNQEFLIAARKP